ncbi:MAG TPA: cytochrome c oxidase subunit II [Thermoanaerobaculia bacterium]|nr:cytochrome c oxidase subunit II [Thermoanaerobaculia bacterium]
MTTAGRGIQSALEPAGMQAEKIADLWQFFLVVCTVVYVLVIIFLLAALFRRRPEIVPKAVSPRVRKAVIAATGLTVITLFALLTASIFTSRGIADVPDRAIQIAVMGRQWWWQVEYDDRDKSKRVTTANEITIPVGVPVTLHLRSSDVIHSFWVPNLHGKRDLIPGKNATTLTIRADRPGVYRGQCAEFCGYQHANMALWVTALPMAEYAKWLEDARKPSKIPSTAEERKGQDVFMNSPCPLCHTIQGTPANGKTGPDLTHFASRRSIAAGSYPNNRGYLGGWILDAQHLKPGAYMPSIMLEQGELQPLIAYLESLR